MSIMLLCIKAVDDGAGMIAGEGLAILAGEFDIYHRRTRTRGRPTSSPGVVSWVSVGVSARRPTRIVYCARRVILKVQNSFYS
jgi:hypothetical protein